MLRSCPTLCDPTDCSPPGSSVHGILQARTLERVRALLQGTFPTQGSNSHLLRLLQWQSAAQLIAAAGRLSPGEALASVPPSTPLRTSPLSFVSRKRHRPEHRPARNQQDESSGRQPARSRSRDKVAAAMRFLFVASATHAGEGAARSLQVFLELSTEQELDDLKEEPDP